MLHSLSTWNITLRNRGLLFALVLAALFPLRAESACTTGQTTCTTDTVNDAAIVAAIRDPTVQLRVYQLWLQQCVNVWAEAASTAGNLLRANYCSQIASGGVARDTLVALIMNATVQGEVLGCPAPSVLGSVAGCMVDVDVNTAIAVALTVTVSAVATTATQVTVGATSLVVASATGIAVGQSIFAAGVPAGNTVQFISGTTVYMGGPGITAALSSTPIVFTEATGLP